MQTEEIPKTTELPPERNTKTSDEQTATSDNIIKEGDMVIVYLDPLSTSCLTLKKDGKLQNKYGHYNHNDIIGKQYGSKVC